MNIRVKPFTNVYLTGLVVKQRRKMSKSLGNSPDPLDLIEKFGADGVRVGLLSASAGNDICLMKNYATSRERFTNKIWNAFKLIRMGSFRDNTATRIFKGSYRMV
jgi:valyl-tRNA synthetase